MPRRNRQKTVIRENWEALGIGNKNEKNMDDKKAKQLLSSMVVQQPEAEDKQPKLEGNNSTNVPWQTFDNCGGVELVGDSLPLLPLCIRALGEWQTLNERTGAGCPVLLNVERDVPLLNSTGKELAITLETVDNVVDTDPNLAEEEEVLLSLNQISKLAAPNLLDSLKCTKITVAEAELYGAAFPDLMAKGLTTIETIPMKGLHKFLEKPTVKESWILPYRNKKAYKLLSVEELEECYWAVKLRAKSHVVTVAILNSIAYFKDLMEMEYWILPNGEKVKIESLRLGALEVVPKNKYLVRHLRMKQIGDHMNQITGTFVPTVAPLPPNDPSSDVTKNIRIRRFDPVYGPVYFHYVIEAPLQDGKIFVIDPTSLQFKYRGPKGTIMAYGDFETYAKNFPGVVIQRLDMNMEMKPKLYAIIYRQAFLLGRENSETDRMKLNIFKNFGYRICFYCGLAERKPEPVNFKLSPRHIFFENKLQDCSRCKIVTYCGKHCQKSDWRNHKAYCKQNSKEVILEGSNASNDDNDTLIPMEHLKLD